MEIDHIGKNKCKDHNLRQTRKNATSEWNDNETAVVKCTNGYRRKKSLRSPLKTWSKMFASTKMVANITKTDWSLSTAEHPSTSGSKCFGESTLKNSDGSVRLRSAYGGTPRLWKAEDLVENRKSYETI